MAHSSPENVSSHPPFSQSQTLFLPFPGQAGVLVRQRRGKRTAKPLQFPSSVAALAWCEKHRTNLVYFFGVVPSLN